MPWHPRAFAAPNILGSLLHSKSWPLESASSPGTLETEVGMSTTPEPGTTGLCASIPMRFELRILLLNSHLAGLKPIHDVVKAYIIHTSLEAGWGFKGLQGLLRDLLPEFSLQFGPHLCLRTTRVLPKLSLSWRRAFFSLIASSWASLVRRWAFPRERISSSNLAFKSAIVLFFASFFATKVVRRLIAK